MDSLFPHQMGTQLRSKANELKIHAAWNLVSIWITARLDSHNPKNIGIKAAENWFLGTDQGKYPTLTEHLTEDRLTEAECLLSGISYDVEFQELLPYILEEHGSGSRASVMRTPSTAIARKAKRKSGIFYTPTDVADYMVKHTRDLYMDDFCTAKVIDPACGTGVFLLSILRNVSNEINVGFSHFNYITSCLHGMDISEHALDAGTFLLLSKCLDELREKHINPRSAWLAIRMNFVQADSLQVSAIRHEPEHSGSDFCDGEPCSLKRLFPHVQNGFDILIGNPPYANMDERLDFNTLKERFASLKTILPNSRVNLYPLFVEMMWQFTRPGCCAAALVTPLSIAYNGSKEYRNCRQAMTLSGGQWQFAFFDREPNALFGEEVKTRNAILFRTEYGNTLERGQIADVSTGPLRKWTSRTRSSLFQQIDFTPLGTFDFTDGIPKLRGKTQTDVFLSMRAASGGLRSFCLDVHHCSLSEVFGKGTTPRIFVGGTAYNFLNVYRPISFIPELGDIPLSDSSIHCLEFKSETLANVVFSILSSNMVFWLWRVLGDGFHVSTSLFEMIPFECNSFNAKEFDVLASIGGRLWCILQEHRFISLNRGRQTIGFRPLTCHAELNVVDSILIQSLGLDTHFVEELQLFVENNTVIDSTDNRRSNLYSYFKERHK